MTLKDWKLTGTRKGVAFVAYVEATDHNQAVRKGSHHPHMMVVQSCVLMENCALWTEPTEAGNQYVLPGCEKEKTRGPTQADLF